MIVERPGRTPCITDDWSTTRVVNPNLLGKRPREVSKEPIEALRSESRAKTVVSRSGPTTKRPRGGGGKKSQVRKTRKLKYKHRI